MMWYYRSPEFGLIILRAQVRMLAPQLVQRVLLRRRRGRRARRRLLGVHQLRLHDPEESFSVSHSKSPYNPPYDKRM